MATVNENIREVQDIIKMTGVIGCLTGSSMIPGEDFSKWEQVPDVDVFVFLEPQLLVLAMTLEQVYNFKPADKANDWKYRKLKTAGSNKKDALSTLKMMSPNGIIANITWKKGRDNMLSVLSSFDMSIIMVGYDISHGFGLDLRTADSAGVTDGKARWSPDPRLAVPNPMRDQDCDMYGVSMWARQFDRVVKYWDRGFDTRPMARFYIREIQRVIDTGKLFNTENGERAFNEFVAEFAPMMGKMREWLADKEDI